MLPGLTREIDAIAKDKGLERAVLTEALEEAVVQAARREFGGEQELEAHFNAELGEIELFAFREVVEEIHNHDLEVDLESALQYDAEARLVTRSVSSWTPRALAASLPKRPSRSLFNACATPSANSCTKSIPTARVRSLMASFDALTRDPSSLTWDVRKPYCRPRNKCPGKPIAPTIACELTWPR